MGRKYFAQIIGCSSLAEISYFTLSLHFNSLWGFTFPLIKQDVDVFCIFQRGRSLFDGFVVAVLPGIGDGVSNEGGIMAGVDACNNEKSRLRDSVVAMVGHVYINMSVRS